MPVNKQAAEIAAAILAGTPIDWPAAERGATPAERGLVEELRLLCLVADFHRQLPAGGIEPETARAGEPAQYWGRLRLIERVGGGSFGDVYRAWDPRLHREVALKLIPSPQSPGQDHAASIIREGRLLARVRHPGVVTIYDAEQIETQVGLCMEFVEGQTVQQRLDRDGVFSAAEAVEIGLQLCDALSAAHQAGVLHRDVKAANLVLKDDGRIVLMDFGAGKHLDDARAADQTGTPLYLAPEVLQGGEATVRSDIYSAGVLLHHMLTGSYPVQAPSLPELRLAHERRTAGERSIERTQALPVRLAAVIEQATDPRPERRHATAAALVSDLRALQHRTRTHRRIIALSAAALVAVTAAGLVLARQGPGWFGSEAAGAVASAREPVRIAILPFATASNTPDGDVLQQGMTKDLIARLQTYDNARVISAASAFSSETHNLSLKEIASRLGVADIVTVRVVPSGDTVAVSARLVTLPDERTIWSREYSRPMSGLLELQRAIALELADELGLRRAAVEDGRPTRNLEAYTLYVRGREALDRFTPDGTLLALRLFEQTLVLDPDYPHVHAGLARVYLQMNPAIPDLTGEEALHRASQAAARALSLDESLPDAHIAEALVRSARADWNGAERRYRRAIELGPSHVVARQEYARWLSLLGRFDEALNQARVAESLDPLSPRAIMAVASVLRFSRRHDEGVLQARKALDIDSGHLAAYTNLGHHYQGLGRFEEAIDAFRRRGGASGNLGNAYARAGRTREARAVLAELEQRYDKTGLGAGDIAQIHSGLGDADRAFEWLGRVDRLHAGWPTNFKVAAVWDPLRSDARFTTLLRRYGLAD